jgi:RNA polymerase sigma-70 factor (ECF subfamily)
MESKKEIMFVLRAQTGDKEAYNQLLKSIQKQLYWHIWNLVGDKNLTEDILQEIFVLIYKKLHQLKQPELFRPWVYRITTRETFRMIKKEKLYDEIITDCELLENISVPEEEDTLDEEIRKRIHLLINKLSPASSTVISLHYIGQLTIYEVAQTLNISANTVKSRLSYGLKSLRENILSDKLISQEEGFFNVH